ncbi:MAG: type III pantothenate kinase [Candidatus Krumholzibacteriia bacterium]
MSWLLIDVGNSRTVALRAPASGGRLAEPVVTVLDEPTPRTDAGAADLAARLARDRGDVLVVGLTSVVPRLTAALATRLPDLRSVDHTWSMPFAVLVEQPETVGADRWCNVAAAVAAGLTDAIVVDAGTATTIDVLADGEFRGGLIAPGMAFAARQLQEKGARLWPVPFTRCELRPGRHTAEALQIGAFHVGVNGVVGTVAGLRAQFPRARVLVTGGLAFCLDQPGWRLDALLTFRGLVHLMHGQGRPAEAAPA